MSLEANLVIRVVEIFGADQALNINGDLWLNFNYPDPWDFNYVTETLECTGNCSARNLYPSGPAGNPNTISIWTEFWTQPHGCTPGDEDYPTMPWLCSDAYTNPKWQHLGNGGTMPDYRWASTNTPKSGQLGYPTLQRFTIVPR